MDWKKTKKCTLQGERRCTHSCAFQGLDESRTGYNTYFVQQQRTGEVYVLWLLPLPRLLPLHFHLPPPSNVSCCRHSFPQNSPHVPRHSRVSKGCFSSIRNTVLDPNGFQILLKILNSQHFFLKRTSGRLLRSAEIIDLLKCFIIGSCMF